MSIGKWILIGFIAVLHGCATPTVDYSGHPIVGTWKWDVSGCVETYNFLKDGTRTGTSYKETFEARYMVSSKPDSNGLYTLYDKVVNEDSGEDCSGSTSDMTGDEINAFVYFQNDKTIYFCFSESKDNCIGPFVRQ